MGKHGHEHNKPHRKAKDSKGHKERSKKEHLLRKERKAEKQRAADVERTRYTLDPRSREKLLGALRALVAENPATVTELPSVFQMLDDGLEVDIVDIESPFVREKLEVVLSCMSTMIDRAENSEGRFVYRKSCSASVREQIENYLKLAQESPREEWMTGMIAHLQGQFAPQSTGPSPGPTPNPDLEAYMEEYNRQNRPKSLLAMHKEKLAAKGGHREDHSGAYIYGEKTLDKKFGKGSFHSSFM